MWFLQIHIHIHHPLSSTRMHKKNPPPCTFTGMHKKNPPACTSTHMHKNNPPVCTSTRMHKKNPPVCTSTRMHKKNPPTRTFTPCTRRTHPCAHSHAHTQHHTPLLSLRHSHLFFPSWGQFLKRLVSARKLNLTREGWIWSSHRLKSAKAPGPFASFHLQV